MTTSLGSQIISMGCLIALLGKYYPDINLEHLVMDGMKRAKNILSNYEILSEAGLNVNSDSFVDKIDISTQSVGNISMDLAAQTLESLAVDIKTQTLTRLAVDIATQTLNKLNVDITAQTLENLNMNLLSQSANLSIVLVDQIKGLSLNTDWSVENSYDVHLQGEVSGLASGATSTLITITLSNAAEYWLYVVHISGTQTGLGRVRADVSGGYDELAGGYFSASNGYIKEWVVPVKRKKDLAEGITQIIITVKNTSANSGDFMATIDGTRVVDTSSSETIYPDDVAWSSCETQTGVDVATIAGSVILSRTV